jgi:hypothetical protein
MTSQYPYAIDNQLTLPWASESEEGAGGNVTQVNAQNSPYNILITDNILAVDATVQPISIYLPPTPNEGDTYFVKDFLGATSYNPIVVSGNGNDIDGQQFYILTSAFEDVMFTFLGTSWGVM